MYRFLLTPRWLGITLLALLAIPFCVFMGTWQLSRFDARVAAQQAAEQAPRPSSTRPVPLRSVLPRVSSQVTTDTANRNVEATGTYDAARQFLVPGRELGTGTTEGFYVLDLLRTDGGAALPVVRGWLPGDASTARDVPGPPAGPVEVTGVLQVPEGEGGDGVVTSALPPGQLGMISAATLVNLVPYPVYNGWITVNRAAAPMLAVPPAAAPGAGLDMGAFQNLGYTGEWFVFAGFVVFLWIRFVRREVEVQRDLALGLIPESPESPESPERESESEAAGVSGEPR